jgi:signal peptidase I
MEPTFVSGEILMVNKLAYKFDSFGYGQVITFHYPLDPKLAYIKRVIGCRAMRWTSTTAKCG